MRGEREVGTVPTPERYVLRALAAKLISTLYGVPLEQVLELDRSCVDASDAGLKIRLGGDWVKVEKPVASSSKTKTSSFNH